MNIKQAKEDIKNAVSAYLTKDKFGNFVIPIEKQRPIFLMGAPGIGKTAIMEQIAEEMKIGLVSYSMTHHTRQSALGLPFIVKKDYGGKEYTVSEYTMSEIIASVYDMIEYTGIKEGILFLDEINCVSETLAPAMLQFLQYKIFGRHRVPNGWIVVTAGNPPEFNNSVREFDIVTWDRLKRLDVEADYETWKEYAYSRGVHAAITTYLDIKKDDFCKIETTVDGKTFVTARGWSDLSEMIKLYEEKGFPVTEQLVGQYLQNKKIAKSFAIYYDLFNKYKSDYQVDKILSGKADGALSELMNCLKTAKADYMSDSDFTVSLERQTAEKQKEISVGKAASNISVDREYTLHSVMEMLSEEQKLIIEKSPKNAADAFKLLKADFDKRKKALSKTVSVNSNMLTNVFNFCEAAFSKGSQEMLILVTELTISTYASHFISHYGCKEYFDNNKDMMFFERQKQIIMEIEDLNLE